MFNKEKNNNSEKSISTSATLISAGTIVNGDIQSESDLRIDGTINGNISTTAKIVLGPMGFVEGNIYGAHADISGKVVGHISVNELAQLRSKSSVKGNITAVNLQIESGAAFNGQSVMTTGNNVIHINEEELLHAEAK